VLPFSPVAEKLLRCTRNPDIFQAVGSSRFSSDFLLFQAIFSFFHNCENTCGKLPVCGIPIIAFAEPKLWISGVKFLLMLKNN
jgi:hypothetical protein